MVVKVGKKSARSVAISSLVGWTDGVYVIGIEREGKGQVENTKERKKEWEIRETHSLP